MSGCVCFVCSLVSVAVGLCFDWSLVLVHNSDYQLNHVGGKLLKKTFTTRVYIIRVEKQVFFVL